MKKVLFYVAAAAMIAAFGCSKKKGCTDSASTNFCSDCKEDDGSCQYQGQMVVWWNKTFADSATTLGVSSIKVYVDGIFINNYVTSTNWTGAPGCGANGSITVTKSLGGSKSKSFSVAMKDQSDQPLA